MNVFRLSKQELNSIKLLNNNVLVKPIIDTSKIELKNASITLDIDIDFEEDIHSQRYVDVVRVPDKLRYSKNNRADTLFWDTEMELKPNDKAWIRSLAAIGNEQTNLTKILVDKDVYFIIKYDDFIVARRGDKVICLNGYVLLQPNREILQEKYNIIYVPEHLIPERKVNTLSWRVKYVGKINKGYKNKSKQDFIEKLNIGDDIIIHRKRRPYKIEDSMYRYFSDDDFYFIQRCEIVGIL